MSTGTLLSPLAERIRPANLDDIFGQDHLLGKGKPVRVMFESGKISSFLMWGPPGTGKTTIAKLLAHQASAAFFQLNAVSSGVRDVREIIKQAGEFRLSNRQTILFIDEIHRFNKAQQDALLGAVESGAITLIGATTENPSFEVIPALRSRMRTYVLNSLTEESLQAILEKTLHTDDSLKKLQITLEDKAFLFYLAGGDARIMLNILETAITFAQTDSGNNQIILTNQILETVTQKKNQLYDKDGEEHFNVISAFIKSLRGSDPDAALYWMARMLEGGEDPLFIARRMLVFASEDIGNASPNALVLAESCFSAIDKIGMPEARIILGQCATYLASSPKSNASYLGIDSALEAVRSLPAYPVPLHLRNAPTGLMKKLGYGKKYQYPHEFDNHFIEENYFPDDMKPRQFYIPTQLGQEKNLYDRLKFLWKNRKNY
ncbi:MAG: replication-associated recombination protein A [Ignavibacteriales bacterium]|nr:replication-associated recombination protein A [Ignavibacteriales bacterium]